MMDRVLFIEDGQLTMSGTPAELAAENKHFQHLLAIDQDDDKERPSISDGRFSSHCSMAQ